MKELNQFIAHKLLPSNVEGVGTVKRQLTAKRAEAAHQYANRGNRPALAAAQPDLTGATGQHDRHRHISLLQAAAATLLDAEHVSSSHLSKATPAEVKATADQADESVHHRALLQVMPSSLPSAQHAATDAKPAAVENNPLSKFTTLLQQQKTAEQLTDLNQVPKASYKQQAVKILGGQQVRVLGAPQPRSRSLLQEEEEAVNMLGEEEARLPLADEVGEVYLNAAEDLTRIAPLWWNYTKQMRVFHETYAKVRNRLLIYIDIHISVSSWREGPANFLCITPDLSDVSEVACHHLHCVHTCQPCVPCMLLTTTHKPTQCIAALG